MSAIKKPERSKIVRDADLVEDPAELVGLFDCFKVVSVTEFGAFLDWGFAKDLFVPWVEQHPRMKEGESYIVYIYCDEAGRFAASARLDKCIGNAVVDVHEGDTVDLLICDPTPLGYKAIVNNAYWGLLYKQEIFQPLTYGQRCEGFVKKVREDGKIDLCLQKPGYAPVDALSEKIIASLQKSGGSMDLTDKTPPEEIYHLFGVSKKKFKMAIGLLYKERRIAIENGGITLLKRE
ncbi:MAG: S1-like domain-containing RNA-binding protein [Candidatus Omnitrophota bacterium]